MHNVTEDVRHEIRTAVAEAIASSELGVQVGRVQACDVPVELTRDKSYGDFSTTVAMSLAKRLRRPPRQIAESIAEALRSTARKTRYIRRVEVAGAGFINFFLSRAWLEDTIRAVHAAGHAYGTSDAPVGRRVQIEFVSANPTGPMNVVNARAGAVGAALASIMRAAGYDVSTEYYINDAGNQVAVLGESVELRYRQLQGESVEFPEKCYQGAYITDIAREAAAEHGEKLKAMAADERTRFFREFALARMLESQKRSLARFGVDFDVWFSERTLVESGAHRETLEILRERGMVYEKDGATWLRTTDFGDDKDRVLVKSDGEYTYLAGDIAYHRNKLGRGFDLIIDIWGPDHHGHVTPTRAGLQALGYPGECLEVLLLQFLSILSGGERVKMSKRAGEFVTMDDLVDEVGRDAARYFLLMRNIESHLDFDLDLAKSQSQENPVYYVQYAHARICSIFRQAEENGVTIVEPFDADLSRLVEDVELDIARKLAAYPDEIATSAADRAPNRLAKYALDLAGLFHSFYNSCRVISDDAGLTSARLALSGAVGTVLRNCLDILGISAPEKM
ncbi:MAG: arginine--tRNA ligase [Bacillota bacterium]